MGDLVLDIMQLLDFKKSNEEIYILQKLIQCILKINQLQVIYLVQKNQNNTY